ncbi:MAG TPA: DUF2752 domain-containing protein [Abditibacterium sp.]|jgi:hypothetical protein
MRFRPHFSAPATLCSAVLALSFLLPRPQNGAILGLPSLCPFSNFSGLPCPGCGLTRSFVCLAHGEFRESLSYHPLGPLLFGAILLFASASILGFAPRFPAKTNTFWLGALVSALLIAWIGRLSGFWPLPT